MAGDAVRHLCGEHGEVLRALEALEQAAASLEREVPMEPTQAAAECRYFLDFFASRVQPHLQREEREIYPALSRLVPPESGTVGAMLADHETVRALADAVGLALARMDALDGARADLAAHARDLALLLREHIRKEEHAIFPLLARAEAKEPDDA